MKRVIVIGMCLAFVAALSLYAQVQQVFAQPSASQTAPVAISHQVGRKIFENGQFSLHETTFGDYCTRTAAHVVMVFKVGPDFKIEDDAVYHRRFESEVLPQIRATCQAPRVEIRHFIQGTRFAQRDGPLLWEHPPGETLLGTEMPLSSMTVYLNGPSVQRYEPDLTFVSVSDARAKIGVRQQAMAAYAVRSAAPAGYLEELRLKKDRQTKATRSADGKLNTEGMATAEKAVFLQIYEGRFIELSRLDNDDYVPYLMFTGVIQGYHDICRSSLSPKAEKVDIIATRFVGSEFEGFQQTDYYEEYLAGTVYVEPQYSATYRSSASTFLSKAASHYVRRSGEDPLAFSVSLSRRGVELAKASRKLITDHGCKNAATLQFIENLHRFVSDQWDTRSGTGFKYFDDELGKVTKRYYAKTPSNFTPPFPGPGYPNNWEIYVNEGHQNQGLRWAEVTYLDDRPFMSVPRPTPLPPSVQAAIEENRFLIAKCTYRYQDYGPTLIFWNANGPLPSPQVQDLAKGVIGAPRTSCPATYAPR